MLKMNTTIGFSLIECLFVIAIMAILIGFAYPNYQNYLSKARRMDGMSALLDLSAKMEHFYSKHMSYELATIARGQPETDLVTNPYSPRQWYRLDISAQSKNSYRLRAIPQKSQGAQDKDCQILTINQLGKFGIEAGPSGPPSGSVEDCWFL